MGSIHVFTSCALNYLPKARMLFRSIRELHPEFVLHLALADAAPDPTIIANEPFDELHALSDLGIPGQQGWAFCHNIVELCTAIKPFVLERLLARDDCDAVIYFDPDMVLFSRVDDIVGALHESNIVLTPHQTRPEASVEAVIDNEICSLKHGIYNLGFIGVAANDEGRRFARWWAERVYHFCRADIPNGLFTDQRWIDLVPAFFDAIGILRSSRHNVATWNLTTRKLTGSVADGLSVDGEPLGFYHFTGFDSGAHAIMASKNAMGNDSVRMLIRWYSDVTEGAARDPLSKTAWAYGQYSNGEKISPEARVVYRERPDLQRVFPDPFDASLAPSFLGWWTTQAPLEYPSLADEGSPGGRSYSLPSGLTPGYRGGSDDRIDWPRVFSTIRQCLSTPTQGARLAKTTVGVIRREGISGLLRRIRSYS